MLSPTSIIERIQPLSAVEGYCAAKTFLQAPETSLHESGSDGRVAAKMIRDIWGFRLDRMRKGIIQHIPGLEHLVDALKTFADDKILKMVIFENDGALGAFWFDDDIGSPVGFVVCKLTTAIEPTRL